MDGPVRMVSGHVQMVVSELDIQFYTPQEVANLLRLRVQTVYEYVRMGKLKAAKFGNRYRISEEDLQQFIEYQKALTQEGLQ